MSWTRVRVDGEDYNHWPCDGVRVSDQGKNDL
jgi:hypothetical protein